MTRFHVVGAGAIGGLTGAFLAKHGEDVTFVDVVSDHVAAINEHGMLVDGVVDEFRVSARACVPQDLEGPLDVVLFSVKSQHTMTALEGIESHIGPQTLVISLQNGLNPDKIASRIGADRVAGAFINFASDYIGPGHIRYGGAGDYYLGRVDGPPDDRLLSIADKFSQIMNTIVTDNIMGFLWAKQCYGSLLRTTALVDAPVHEVLSVPENREAITVAVQEAVAVADAYGVELEPFEPFDPALFRGKPSQEALDDFFDLVAGRFKARVKQHTGVWRDLKVRRRETEVKWTSGEVITRGKERGMDLPLNECMVQMINEIERGEREQRWENILEMHRLIRQNV